MAAFIKFDGVNGGATEKNHKGWSRILSFNQGLHQPGAGATGQTRRRGDAILDDIIVSKKLDKSSLNIAEAALRGKVFPKVDIHLTASYVDAGRQTYYEYELKNVMVTSYNINATRPAANVPVDELTLNFEEVKVIYTEMTKKGKVKGKHEYTWKVEEGES